MAARFQRWLARGARSRERPGPSLVFSKAASVACVSAVIVAGACSRADAQISYSGCGQPVTHGRSPGITDCLYLLRASVGAERCHHCYCLPAGDGELAADDVLVCLQAAIGLEPDLACPCSMLETYDYSSVDRVWAFREPALGYCVATGHLVEAEVLGNGAGDYAFAATTLESGVPGLDECNHGYANYDPDLLCPVLRAHEARSLEAGEREALLRGLSAVEVDLLAEPECEWLIYDPCVIDHFGFDDDYLADHPCEPPRLTYAESYRLIDLLEGFVRRP